MSIFILIHIHTHARAHTHTHTLLGDEREKKPRHQTFY